MSDREFKIGEREFKLRKIDAFKQFHIVRRATPILTELLPMMKDVQKAQKNLEQQSEEEKLENIAKFIAPIMSGLSKLSDEDSNKVLYGLLSSAEVKQPTGNWAPVATDTMLMMQDIELPTLLMIAGRAFMFNLSGFFAVLPRS